MSYNDIKPNSIIHLEKTYQDYVEDKEDFLNHSKVIEYLFNKPTPNIETLPDLLKIDYNSTVKPVRLEMKDRNFLDIKITTMRNLADIFKKQYRLIQKKLHLTGKILNFPLIPSVENHKRLQLIRDILDKMILKVGKNFTYVQNWNFLIEGQHNNLLSKPKINIEQSFLCHFYGLTMWNNQLVKYVIIYDRDEDFDPRSRNCKQNHLNRIIQQYILWQTNIHLLRLNKSSDIQKEIKTFFHNIRNNINYVRQNAIQPIREFFVRTERVRPLVNFQTEYKQNHIIYLKYHHKKNPKYDTDDNEFFDQLIMTDMYSERPMDRAIVIPSDFANQIINEKSKLKFDVGPTEAEKIVIELVGLNDD